MIKRFHMFEGLSLDDELDVILNMARDEDIIINIVRYHETFIKRMSVVCSNQLQFDNNQIEDIYLKVEPGTDQYRIVRNIAERIAQIVDIDVYANVRMRADTLDDNGVALCTNRLHLIDESTEWVRIYILPRYMKLYRSNFTAAYLKLERNTYTVFCEQQLSWNTSTTEVTSLPRITISG
jgi:hypothetical protein